MCMCYCICVWSCVCYKLATHTFVWVLQICRHPPCVCVCTNTHTTATTRAPAPPYDCPICYNETTRTRFWGFVSCVVKLQDVATGRDARLQQLSETGYNYRFYAPQPGLQEPEVIAASASPPEQPVSAVVHVPNAEWTLLVAPQQGAVVVVVVVLHCGVMWLQWGGLVERDARVGEEGGGRGQRGGRAVAVQGPLLSGVGVMYHISVL